MHDIATPMPTATVHALSPTLPKIFGDTTPLSQPSRPSRSPQSSLSHFATRPPTQPSASTTLGIESHTQEEDCAYPDATQTIHRLVYVHRRSLHVRAATHRLAVATLPGGSPSPTSRCKPMTGFPNLKAGSRGAPGSTPFSVDICASFFRPIPCPHVPAHHTDAVVWLVVALVFIQWPDAAIMCVAARIFDVSTRREIAQIQDVATPRTTRLFAAAWRRRPSLPRRLFHSHHHPRHSPRLNAHRAVLSTPNPNPNLIPSSIRPLRRPVLG
ncbi:hypothetical protein B0H13DRAFT_2563149 [Mycena leptocephala]|nr:hypothetical protein B0H13DRAFT_2563149 [Mycena leptocephala]